MGPPGDSALALAIEDTFRLFSFEVYYHKTFREEKDHTVRFAKAIIASSQPILDWQPVIHWWRDKKNRRRPKVDRMDNMKENVA